MSLHDAYARTTPIEVAFPDGGAAAELFESFDREARTAGTDLRDLAAFMQIASVGNALRELRAPDVGGEAIHRYAVLLHQSTLFHRAGGVVHLPTAGVIRYLVDGAPDADELDVPAPAGYLQLPRHLFWVQVEAERHESVDGLFWSLGQDGALDLLLAQGLLGGRPGLSVAPVAQALWSEARQWLDASVREEGPDFATTLPGGELEGLYSFVAAGEPLKLFARVCAFLGAFPDAVEAGEYDPARIDPKASRYSFQRLVLETR